MYKVFIKKNELSFINECKKKDNSTIILSENIADKYKNELINRLFDEQVELKCSILTENIESYFLTFFSTFLKIEAAGGIVKRKNSYLFIFRRGFWDLPKGKIDFGETPEQAAIREIEEECGISSLNIKKKLKSTFHLYNDYGEITLKKTFWFLLNYKGDKDLIPQKEEDIEKAEWIKLDMINEKIIPFTYPSIKQVWKFYLKKYLKS